MVKDLAGGWVEKPLPGSLAGLVSSHRLLVRRGSNGGKKPLRLRFIYSQGLADLCAGFSKNAGSGRKTLPVVSLSLEKEENAKERRLLEGVKGRLTWE